MESTLHLCPRLPSDFRMHDDHLHELLGHVRRVPDVQWVRRAVELIAADFNRSADTHLIKVVLPGLGDIDLYLKDESTHPSGSLKHRLARSLMLYGLCNGLIHQGTTLVESSSGSTAISEAYFARLLGLSFIAVVPVGIAPEKIRQIELLGGRCEKVPGADIYAHAAAVARATGGHYVDQFTYAERATDWRGNNNIAESLFAQMARERYPIPSWVVVGAGTGGTSATLGRYIRYRPELCARTSLCVVDPEHSVFFDHYRRAEVPAFGRASRIEGIGRPRVEPSFCPEVIDRMLRIPDAASIGAAWWLMEVLDRKVGGSTGTAVFGATLLIDEMVRRKQVGSVVALLCDGGDRYLNTYYNPEWLKSEGIDIAPWNEALQGFGRTGTMQLPVGVAAIQNSESL